MNRPTTWASRACSSGPHTRGDEPERLDVLKTEGEGVPTRVGMNRSRRRAYGASCRGPHTRGDEPHEKGSWGGVATGFPKLVGESRRVGRRLPRTWVGPPH